MCIRDRSHALADIPPPRRAPAAEVPQPVADRAIVGALQVVLDAAPGSRNGRLFWAGCRLFERVHDARLEDGQAEEMLLAAAEAVGLSAGEAIATIRSARRAVHRP